MKPLDPLTQRLAAREADPHEFDGIVETVDWELYETFGYVGEDGIEPSTPEASALAREAR